MSWAREYSRLYIRGRSLSLARIASCTRSLFPNQGSDHELEKRSFKMTKRRATHFYSTQEVDAQSLEAMCEKLVAALQSSDSFRKLVEEIRDKDSNLKLTLSASIFHAPID